ncbi:uncharacterized protein LOC117111167 [Anneissia japonica]|uniref:uncharacterized protein LOC117111167 n=1 Tax=Anneissia japonica TaxID=1529436 RepID=UPI001425700D|nr:uncharacterized protein LOC117111167 [Anneissia japonica]
METHAFLKLQRELKSLREQAIKDSANPEEIDETFSQVFSELSAKTERNRTLTIFFGVTLTLISCLAVAVQFLVTSVYDDPCLIYMHALPEELSRPIADCSMCKDLTTVPRYDFITKEEFELKHAYTSQPAVIAKGTENWTASKNLTFSYLKELYLATADVDNIQGDCAFFGYRTDFVSLKHAFESITTEMENVEPGSPNWYIGWSNCDENISSVIHQLSSKPYFLPERSRQYNTWIFAGSPGVGAGIHIDTVDLPSWQAQILGRKTWTLTPPPECEHICQTINATLNQGDIIVVNTNQWYHSTTIHEGSISLSIGSEYD